MSAPVPRNWDIDGLSRCTIATNVFPVQPTASSMLYCILLSRRKRKKLALSCAPVVHGHPRWPRGRQTVFLDLGHPILDAFAEKGSSIFPTCRRIHSTSFHPSLEILPAPLTPQTPPATRSGPAPRSTAPAATRAVAPKGARTGLGLVARSAEAVEEGTWKPVEG